MLQRLRVKNLTEGVVRRGGIDFLPLQERDVAVGMPQYREIKACRFLRILDEPSETPAVATTAESDTTALTEAVVKVDNDEAAGEDDEEEAGEYECPHCEHSAKTAAGRSAHIRAKHPDVESNESEGGS